eukprot:6264251-Amphidinium_carterae.1
MPGGFSFRILGRPTPRLGTGTSHGSSPASKAAWARAISLKRGLGCLAHPRREEPPSKCLLLGRGRDRLRCLLHGLLTAIFACGSGVSSISSSKSISSPLCGAAKVLKLDHTIL